ncbi:LysR family transcriptional regulator [Vibrio sp. SCSIO 43140]|uniref:LysR family transcriptional regulator n=1 Tax=Vibrio sp. SCSIO 43140 TaxID=2819100 RepID=UPI002075A36A|nr:LysR family transcriptional regulator [Vibrio sp. SCSIO 43140]USD63047.1 LysR family transcriptional regulator [Vibrio sp. SCSIO 43140]
MTLSDFDLNLMRVFLTVYRCQSITVAAEVLNLTQPGVSGALKRLQNQLGQKLFVRDGRGIAPTHLAHEMARQIEPALEAIENTLTDAQEFTVEGKRRFVVYTTEPVMLKLVPKIEADKSLGNCEVVLCPTTVSEAELLEKLNLRQADLAIEFSESSTSSHFTQPFFSDQICVIASKNHPRIQGNISTQDYYQEKHITLKLRREEIFLVDYFTEEHIQPRKVAAECESLLALMALVASSESIGMTSVSMATQFAEQFGLQILEAPFNSLSVDYVLMGHKREQNSKANIWLREKLLSYVLD